MAHPCPPARPVEGDLRQPAEVMLGRLHALLPGACLVAPDTIGSSSEAKGAYALLAHLGTPQNLVIRRQVWPLATGWHVYVGSAKGPGGMRARLGRHVRRDKTPHWHIDRLTMAANALAALALAGGTECDIAARLAGSGWFGHVLPGFGSSDCRLCPSHLLVPLAHAAVADFAPTGDFAQAGEVWPKA